MKMKRCSKCKQELPFAAFHKNSLQYSGLSCRCKFCIRKKNGSIKVKLKHKIDLNKKILYHLKKMYDPDFGKKHYKRYAEYYKKKRDKRQRGLKHVKKYENPFEDDIMIEWHHINNEEVVAIPKELHHLYMGGGREIHREKLKYIVEQIYGGD